MMRVDLDLNLMKTLLVVAENKSLKRAGMRLGLTESAVSKQLARLREQLDDELFVRVAGRLEPSDYTASILPAMAKALADIEQALIRAQFDPSQHREAIHLALPDLVMAVLGLTLYETLQARYPSAPITLHNWSDETERRIASGEYQLGIHLLVTDRGPGIYQQRLCHDQLVVATASEHGEQQWQEVKTWPFIKQRAVGWNEQRFQFIEHLERQQIKLNYAHDIDTASFALKLMARQWVANVLPERMLGSEFCAVHGAEALNFAITWASCVRCWSVESLGQDKSAAVWELQMLTWLLLRLSRCSVGRVPRRAGKRAQTPHRLVYGCYVMMAVIGGF